jgi:predicted Zn finger-like uncharacterized protein
MYTQCPECSVAFRVTAEVLKQAAGKVRCGGCGNAFNALEFLSEDLPEQPPKKEVDDDIPELKPEPLESKGLPKSISAEQSAALLKTLDELAGSDIRIEDTGVEWRVLDEAELGDAADDERAFDDPIEDQPEIDELLEESPTPVDQFLTETPHEIESPEIFEADADEAASTHVDELRFDDNTPLPDDFGMGDAPSEAPPEDADTEVHDADAEVPDPDESDSAVEDIPQHDLDLSEPDEWTEILNEFEELTQDISEPGVADEIKEQILADDDEVEDEGDEDELYDEEDDELDDDDEDYDELDEEDEYDDELDEEDEDDDELDEEDEDDDEFDEEDEDDDELDEEDEDDDELDEEDEDDDELDEEDEDDDEFDEEDEDDDELDEEDEDDDELDEEDEDDEEPEDTENDAGRIYIPPMTDEEQTINMQIDQDLFAIAVEDENGLASTMAFARDSISKSDSTEHGDEDDGSGQSLTDTSTGFETIIMEGEFVRSTVEQEKRAAQVAAAAGLVGVAAAAEREAEEAAQSGGRKYGLIFGIVVLLLALTGQYLHQSRDTLATIPAFNNVAGPLYRALGQPLSPKWDITGWRFEATKGSTDDTDANLTIYSRIGNKSDKPLPYPLIGISLTDRFEETIGSRILDPADYLSNDLDPRKLVQPGETFNAVITIQSAAEEATGFKLNVCYRESGGNLRCAIDDFK